MRWPPFQTPELKGSSLDLMHCVAHYLATQFGSSAPEVVDCCHPPSVRISALQRHFSPGMLQLALLALIKQGLMKRTDPVEGAVHLTERGVLYLERAGLVPALFRHNFGDFPTPDDADVEPEQLPDEDDDDFDQRCSDAHMDALEEIDIEFSQWAKEIGQMPDFMRGSSWPSGPEWKQ